MTYWLYDPKKLASSSTLIPYKQTNSGEILNFLSVSCIFLYFYIYKTKQTKKYGNLLAFIFLSIFFLGIIFGKPKNKIENNFNFFGDYENSLFID